MSDITTHQRYNNTVICSFIKLYFQTVAERRQRSYCNRLVWWAHKGQVLAQSPVTTRGFWTVQPCVTSLSLACLQPLTITRWVPTFTLSRESIQLRKTAVGLLTDRSSWKCWSLHASLGNTRLFMVSLFLFIWRHAQSNSCQSLCEAQHDVSGVMYPLGPGEDGWNTMHPVPWQELSIWMEWRWMF